MATVGFYISQPGGFGLYDQTGGDALGTVNCAFTVYFLDSESGNPASFVNPDNPDDTEYGWGQTYAVSPTSTLAALRSQFESDAAAHTSFSDLSFVCLG